jgi:uncharacterized protein (DUF2236 family)
MSGRSEEYRRFAADSSLVLGGLAAILLQIAHPVVARGVAAHSSFARNPLPRLRGTLAYVYAITLGTEEDATRAARRVDASHARVAGARDLDPQLGVAATLARLSVTTHALVRGPVEDALADEVHTAGAALGTALQVPAGAWPADRDAFDAYWDEAVARLEVGADARGVAAELFAARAAPWWVRLAMPATREFTTLLLPPAVREAYGIPWHPRRARAVLAIVRTLARLTPRRLRELPSRRLLAEPRRRR